MATTLYYANILTPLEHIYPGTVVVSDDGKITYVGTMEDAPQAEGLRINLQGLTLVPGFIDIHVHGGYGVTFGGTNDAAEELKAYSDWVVRTGVSGYLCSLAAKDAESLAALVAQYVEVMKDGVPGAEPLGIHLEGPFMSKEKKGAFNPDWLRLPSLDEAKAVLKAGQGWIRQMTLAPELPDADKVASYFRQAGVVVALGHTNTDYAIASAALKGSYTHVTHTFNAQSGFHHRKPGVFGAIMSSDLVTAELIADAIHAHPAAMKILIRCLRTDRIALITDAMAGAGLQDGVYDLVGQTVTVKDGHATLADGTIAGSTATLNQCVRNIHQLVGVPLPDAVKMASLIPARAMGFASRLGSIRPGKDASLTAIDDDAKVFLTLVRGKVAYNNL
ncbi:MAG: N-acetylglucosamine-6-phosphate deacetylase [Anaerolineae bacterium UTCFX2]|jgi:N-acetylglucosamine-6-phosphate deacetylase|nr:N-acetylglucosamine-6-phosphate deacetylase [Anaerolineales bacterium]OQY91459.1 MAG: N-acetylglucosamine-6-phosphate deacetylase [Anaerolineae bacterium UTCFX2]